MMKNDSLRLKQAGVTLLLLYYAVSFLEGSAVMACELAGAKLIAPFYGNSLYVWSSVLGTTLGGLTAGYYLGGIISEKPQVRKYLIFILLISTLLMVLTPAISSIIMNLTISLSVQLGSLLSCLVFIFPVLLCFGMVSPVIIRIVSSDVTRVGKKAGTVYAISTVGGLIMTFSMGFYFIPTLGLKMSCYLTAILLAIATALSVIGYLFIKSPANEKESTPATAR
jgi:predicted membrane-bound spermidine synthase